MAFITDKTQVNELSQIQIPKCYENYVNKAISESVKLLTMKEFIDITGFEVNAETFDILFMNINDEGIGVYINEIILDWMGYNGAEYKNKLQDCKYLLKKNFEENIDYKILKNKDYELFLNKEKEKYQGMNFHTLINKTYPEPSTGASASSKKHLIVMPDTFRQLCMMITTDKGKQIKKYYITLEKLIKAYNLYQVIFKGQELERAMICKGDKIDELLLTIKQNEIKADVERKKADEERKKADDERIKADAERIKVYEQNLIQNRIQDEKINRLLGHAIKATETLKVVAQNHVEVNKLQIVKQHKFIILKDTTNSDRPYYVIRSQKGSIRKIISTLNTKHQLNMVIWFELEQPNSVAFYNILKKELKQYMTRDGLWFSIKDITEDNFKSKIYDINRRRICE